MAFYYKTIFITSAHEPKLEENTEAVFLFSIAGLGTSAEDLLSKGNEEILANESDILQVLESIELELTAEQVFGWLKIAKR